MKRQFTLVALFLCTLCTFAQFSGSGSGTSSDPYQITSAYQLSQMRNFLNQEDVYFKLMNDIDLTDFIAEEYLSQGWLPIGVESSPFKGTFDGNEKTITGLTINRTASDYMGLFGYAINGTIKKLTIQDCEINGKGFVGALVGCACCTISDCSISGNVTGTGDNVGGFCGCAKPSIFTLSNCNYFGDVKGNQYVGGLCGLITKSTISNSNYTGEVSGVSYIGGIFGSGYGSLQKCYVNGIVKGNSDNSNYIGGVGGYLSDNIYDGHCLLSKVQANITGANYVGGMFGYFSSTTNVAVRESFVEGNIIASGNYVGGLVGYLARAKITDCYYNGIVKGVNFVGGLIGSCYAKNGLISILNCYSNSTIEGSGNIGGITGHIGGRNVDSYVTYYAKLNSCIEIDTKITATSTSVGRIYGSIGQYTNIGATGSPQENKALNTTAVYINNKLQTDITDGPQHGTGTSMSSLKRQDTYVGLGWDFDTVWGIDEGTSFPYLLNNPNTPTQSLTVTIPTTMKYGDTPISLPATTDQGKALTWTSSNNSVLSVGDGKLTPVKVGFATITATEAGNNSSNAFSQTFDVTVNKAPLVITAKSYTIAQGTALPNFEATYSGFKNGETESVLTTQPTFSCSAISASTPGSYTIIPSGATATNYSITYVNGTLTIEAGSGDIDVNIVIPSSGMTTYCSAYDLNFSNVTAFKAYVIVGYSKKTNKVVALQVDEAPAGTGLFLKGVQGTYQMSIAESESYHTDMLAGVINATTIQATEGRYTNLIPYTLAGSTFFIPANNGSNVDANRAYLQIETARYNGQPVEIFLLDENNELFGDMNKDGVISITDVTFLVDMILGM